MLPNMDLLMAPVSISLLEFISNQQNKALMYSTVLDDYNFAMG